MLFHVNVSFCSAHHCSFSGHSNLLNYEIPKDALVLTNLYAVHRQKDLRPAHDRFIPEANFLRLGEFKAAEEKGASVKQNGSSFGSGTHRELGAVRSGTPAMPWRVARTTGAFLLFRRVAAAFRSSAGPLISYVFNQLLRMETLGGRS